MNSLKLLGALFALLFTFSTATVFAQDGDATKAVKEATKDAQDASQAADEAEEIANQLASEAEEDISDEEMDKVASQEEDEEEVEEEEEDKSDKKAKKKKVVKKVVKKKAVKNDGMLHIKVKQNSKLFIDGKAKGVLKANVAKNVFLSAGMHKVKIQPIAGKNKKVYLKAVSIKHKKKISISF